MRWSLPAAAMRVVALLLLPLAEAYVPSGPLPVRSRAAAVTRQAAQMSGAMDGWPSRRNPNSGPPIDEERRSRSPGLQNNFYEISTADFKRPHGTGRAPPPPSDGSPDAASAGAPPAPSPPPAAPIDPKTGRALYSVGEETPMPGREREYEAYNGATNAAAEPPTAQVPPPAAAAAAQMPLDPSAAAAQMPPPAATGAAPPLDSTLSALYQKLEQARPRPRPRDRSAHARARRAHTPRRAHDDPRRPPRPPPSRRGSTSWARWARRLRRRSPQPALRPRQLLPRRLRRLPRCLRPPPPRRLDAPARATRWSTARCRSFTRSWSRRDHAPAHSGRVPPPCPARVIALQRARAADLPPPQARVDLSRTTTLETTGPLVALVKDISAAIGNLEKL